MSKYKLVIEADTLEEIQEVINVSLGKVAEKVVSQKTAETKAEPAPEKPKTTSKKSTKTKEKPAETKAEPTPEKKSEGVEYADVKKALNDLSVKKGREAVESVLQDFGIPNAKQLKEEQYQAFIDALVEKQGE